MERERYVKRERYYTEGNTVRKVYYEEAPKRQLEPERKKVASPKEQVRPKTAINFGYVFTLVAAAVVVVFLSITYLTLQAENNSNGEMIANLQNEINTLNADNNVKELDIYSGIDYDALYMRALELGMGNASSDQVVEYDRGTLEYVKQYEDIPTAQ